MERLLFRDRREQLRIKQREIEIEVGRHDKEPPLPTGTIGAIESGRIPVPDSYFSEVLTPALDRLAEKTVVREEVMA